MAEHNKHKGQANQGGNANHGNANQGTLNKGGQQNQGQGQGAAAGVAQMAREAAGSVSRTAGDVAHSAADQAEHAAETVGGGMRSLADSIRENAPRQGMFGTAAGTVADTLEHGGQYLQEEGLSGMVNDVAGMVRRNPIPCVLCCLAVGFFLGRVLTTNTRSY